MFQTEDLSNISSEIFALSKCYTYLKKNLYKKLKKQNLNR